MTPDPNTPKRKPLVTVEWQREVDVFTRQAETRVFVKMYFDARDSGLLGALPDELWKTLCLLATYMDQNGNCFPSQAELARHLNIRREAVNKRVQRLLDFRFNGEPVISVARPMGEAGRWARNHYTIHPISSFAIFDNPKTPKSTEKCSMCGQPHMEGATMCAPANMAERHTNKTQILNQTHTGVPSGSSTGEGAESARVLVAYFHKQVRHPASQKPTAKELAQATELAGTHGEERARGIIDYALARAAETNFRMQHFGGVMLYVPQAVEALEQRENRNRIDQEKQARERAKREAEDAAFSRLPIDQQIAGYLEAKVMMFKLKSKRFPTEEEIEAMRQELMERRAAEA